MISSAGFQCPVGTLRDPSLPGVVMDVATDWQRMESVREEWDAFVQYAGGDIYSTFDWCRIWWKHYGDDRRLCVLVFRDQGRIVGLLPMMIERLGLGPLHIRLAKLISSDYTITVMSLPVLKEYASRVFRMAIAHLIGEDRCDAVSLGPLSGEPSRAPILDLADEAARDSGRIIKDRSTTVHTIVHLPDTVEEYRQSLPRHVRRNHRRRLNKLSKDFRPEFKHCRTPEEIEEHLADFEGMHEAFWRAGGRLGHFGDWPGSSGFTRDLLLKLACLDRADLLVLNLDGKAVAYELSFFLDKCDYWRLGARLPGPEWDAYSLGTLCSVYRFEADIARGVSSVEAGPGHYDYKLHLGGREYPLRSLVVSADRSWAVLKTRFLILWADLVHFVYYRCWFGRIARLLPFKRRPLRRFWIRTRV